jgi:hypothetical protein
MSRSLVMFGLMVAMMAPQAFAQQPLSRQVFARASVAQQKSQQQASEGRMRHVGGSMGAGRFEGVGFSSRSAEDAIRQCCFWGRRTPVDIGVQRGPGGWYAAVLYR